MKGALMRFKGWWLTGVGKAVGANELHVFFVSSEPAEATKSAALGGRRKR
jgi:hypothetical protein